MLYPFGVSNKVRLEMGGSLGERSGKTGDRRPEMGGSQSGKTGDRKWVDTPSGYSNKVRLEMGGYPFGVQQSGKTGNGWIPLRGTAIR